MVSKKIVLVFLILGIFLLIPFVSSLEQMGGEYSKQGASYMDAGVVVNTLVYETVKANKAFSVYMTPYEQSGKTINASDVSCRFGIVSPDGARLYLLDNQANFTIISDGDIWVATIPASFVNETGTYLFNWDCQKTLKGGYFNGHVEVTNSGEDLTEGLAIVYVGLLGILIFVFLVIVGLIGFLPMGDNKNEEGEIMSINNLKFIKPILYGLAYGILMAIMFLAANISIGYLVTTMFGNFLFMIFKIMGYLLTPFLIFWVIWIFARISKDKEIRKYISRGGSGYQSNLV